MYRIRLVLASAGALATVGCATAINGSAESMARLEQQHAANPTAEDVERSLGIAYYKAKRYDDAQAALQRAASMDPRDGVAALYLGLTSEERNDVTGARKAYAQYLEVGRSRATRNEIRVRMEALKLKEMQLEARRALARESDLAGVQGPQNSVAVMPFTFTGPDTSLKPLERGFAELVTTDLSRVSKLTVVERARLQAVLDEMELQQREGVSAGTGVRLGHVLRVRQVVAGSIQQQGNELITNAIAVNAATSAATPEARDRETVDNVFIMEKNVVLELLVNMHVQLTTVERNAIEQRPTRSLAAFVAFSRGLQLEDQGQLDDARRAFDEAVRIDPRFQAARVKSDEVRSAASGMQVSASAIEASLLGATSEGSLLGTTGGGAAAVADGINPSTAAGATTGGGSTTMPAAKDPSSGSGADNPGPRRGHVSIGITQPGRHP